MVRVKIDLFTRQGRTPPPEPAPPPDAGPENALFEIVYSFANLCLRHNHDGFGGGGGIDHTAWRGYMEDMGLTREERLEVAEKAAHVEQLREKWINEKRKATSGKTVPGPGVVEGEDVGINGKRKVELGGVVETPTKKRK